MSKSPIHEQGASCPSCEQKLLSAHSTLGDWFRKIKANYPAVHIAWAYRDSATQNKLFKEKKTHAQYPMSKHNKTVNGRPCAEALDLFVISEEGEAKWPPLFYAKVNADNERDKERIVWAGKWKSFLETCHFELPENKNAETV